ncbi:hypothetical protein FJZ36_06315 [Candidatus Poribacteria bacterium]|nr:hypothetical protein [Candidatus Poribacteria bacterium]
MHDTTAPYVGSQWYIRIVVCALFAAMGSMVSAQLADPLGNPLFFGKGTPIYGIDARYGLLEGSSTLSRNKLFREKTGNRNYFVFDIQRPTVRHQLTVGNFPAKHSAFTLSKELFDAVRWTVTVPRARGSASVFLSRLTNPTFDSAGRPIEGKDIESRADWFMAGLRAETNLGARPIRVADLAEVNLPLPRIGISYVNRFFTSYDLARATNPFRGVVTASPPSELRLRFRDGSPDDGGGARVHRVQVVIDGDVRYDVKGGRELPGILEPGSQSRRSLAGDAREANGDAAFVYRFPLFSPQDIRSVEFRIDIANDYVVELSRDGATWERKLDADGNVQDGANRRVRSFHYGELTDETTFGVDIQTTLGGFAIESERSWYSQTLQYPLFDAERRRTVADAWYVEVNRRFGPLFWSGEYTTIDPFYNASSFIDDNDNEDPYLDAREPSVPFAGSDQDDRDRDGVKDWDDDFLLFEADPPKFLLGLSRESMDFNNNGVPDNLEDNTKPNYRLDYDEGSRGFHTYAIVDLPIAKGLALIPGYYEKSMTSSGTYAVGAYQILAYEPTRIPDFGFVKARYTVRRSRDEIPDDVIFRGKLVRDELALGDYLGNIVTFIADYDNVPKLTIRSKFKYEFNTLFASRTHVTDAQLINQVRYQWQMRDDMVLSPAFRNDRTLGFASPADPAMETSAIRNAYMLTLTHQVAQELQLSGGVQYLTWRDLVVSRNDYNRRVGFLELVLQGKAFGQDIGLITTVDFVNQAFLQPVGGNQRETNISVGLFVL